MVIAGIITLRMAVKEDAGYFWLFGACVGCLLSATFLGWEDIINPSAIDVYQGKTTLEITYKDGVAIDSVVVFKNEKK